MSSNTETQAITGIGFRPSVVRLEASVDGTAIASWGIYDGSVNRCIYHRNEGYFNVTESAGSLFLVTAIEVRQKASVSSLDDDGFTLSWIKEGSPTGSAVIIATCYR